MEGSWMNSSGLPTQHDYNSSSNSNNGSISTISSSSRDSDYKMNVGAGDLEADADSISHRQSALSSDQMENEDSKLGSKHPQTGMIDSFGEVGTVKNALMQDTYKSDFDSVEGSSSAITGGTNEKIGSHWNWDDDRDMGMDIQALLSEFGDFGDFFENDVLPFGEPPGTAESKTLMFSAPDCGEVGSSPIGVMDVADQMLLPVGFPSFETFNLPLTASVDECIGKNDKVTQGPVTSGPLDYTPSPSIGEFDRLIKVEALMTFAPEYGAVEAPKSELSSSIFRSPYYPKSCKLKSSNSSSNNYTYNVLPPSSPCLDGSDEMTGMLVNGKTALGRHDTKKYYTHVESMK